MKVSLTPKCLLVLSFLACSHALTVPSSLPQYDQIHLYGGHHKHRHPHSDIPPVPPHEIGLRPEFWAKIGISLGLVLLGGVFSGLTLGLMGLDELHLRVLATSSESVTERRNAEKVLKLLKKGRHWVLVVLLLSNVIVNESLPVFLDTAIGGGMAAVAISTITIVIFGIIPQAVSVRYGLSIGAKCTPLVLALMWILAPIAFPIAKLLDLALGVHGTQTYKKRELKSFLGFHAMPGSEEPLKEEEVRILGGVLELGAKRVEEIMTKIEDVMTLSADTILDRETLDTISDTGYSRIPVHLPGNPTAFVGLLLVKQLLRFDRSELENVPVSNLPLSLLPEAYPGISCWQALDYFQTGRAHLLLISTTPGVAGGAIGIVTLEDIIEEIISEEIVDETDVYEDNVSRRMARRAPCASIMRGTIVEYSPDSFSDSGPPSLSCASTVIASPAFSTPTNMDDHVVNDEEALGLGMSMGMGTRSSLGVSLGESLKRNLKSKQGVSEDGEQNGAFKKPPLKRGGMSVTEVVDLLGKRVDSDDLESEEHAAGSTPPISEEDSGSRYSERTGLLRRTQDDAEGRNYQSISRKA